MAISQGVGLAEYLRRFSRRVALGVTILSPPACEGADLSGAAMTVHAALLASPGPSVVFSPEGTSRSPVLAVVATTAPLTVDLRSGRTLAPGAPSHPARRSAAAVNATSAHAGMPEMDMGSMHTAFFTDGWGWGPFMFQKVKISSAGELTAAILLSGVFGAFSTATVVAGKWLESVGANPAAKPVWVAVGFVSTAVRTGSHYVAMLLVMSFNVWIILAVVLGQSAGFLLLALLGRIALVQGWGWLQPSAGRPLLGQGRGQGQGHAGAPEDAAGAAEERSWATRSGAEREPGSFDSARSRAAFIERGEGLNGGGSCCSGNDSVSMGGRSKGLLAHLAAVPELLGNGGDAPLGNGGRGEPERGGRGQESSGCCDQNCGCS